MTPISRNINGKCSFLRGIVGVRLRRRIHSLLLTLVILLTILAGLVSPAAADAPRAVWVWENDTFRLLDQRNSWDKTFTFLSRRNLTTVYLYADEYRKRRNIIRDEPEKYRQLIANLHSRGFKVYALLGSMYLRTQEYILPERRSVAAQMFENVLLYNAGSNDAERFDGINIDIEPYLLDDWPEKRTLLAIQYLNLSAEFMRLKRESGDTLAVGPAMPFWFDGIDNIVWQGKCQRLSEHVQDIYDYVALMDYRNFAQGSDGIISHATDEIEYADRKGKSLVIGIETLQTKPDKVTFYGKNHAAIEEQLRLTETALSSHPSFSGFAIHHLGSYMLMSDSKPKH